MARGAVLVSDDGVGGDRAVSSVGTRPATRRVRDRRCLLLDAVVDAGAVTESTAIDSTCVKARSGPSSVQLRLAAFCRLAGVRHDQRYEQSRTFHRSPATRIRMTPEPSSHSSSTAPLHAQDPGRSYERQRWRPDHRRRSQPDSLRSIALRPRQWEPQAPATPMSRRPARPSST